MHLPFAHNYLSGVNVTDFCDLPSLTVSLSGRRSGLPKTKDSLGSVRVNGLGFPTSSLRRRMFDFLQRTTYSPLRWIDDVLFKFI